MLNHMCILGLVGVLVAVSSVVYKAEAGRAFFVFGDSLVDSGNNNYLATTARADSPPYGIDYSTHQPTGRFSNGLNFPDIIGEAMGLQPVMPCLDPQFNGPKMLNGANFASAGIGILNDTGFQFVSVLRLYRQFELFQQYQRQVSVMIGPDQTMQLVGDAVFLITVGGNDFVNNYFLPMSMRSRQISLPDYCQYLIKEYEKHLLKLYDLGARRVLVTGTGPLGCVPGELAMSRSRNGQCAPEPQRAANMFNTELFQMIEELNAEIGSDVFVAANAFAMNMDLISNPQKFGFTTSKTACCGQGMYNGLGLCTVLSNLCRNRNEYVFWDAFHPTERANRVLVQQLMMSGSVNYMKPMNLSTIMAIDAML